MWAVNGLELTTCPRSSISPDSRLWLEEYFAWRLLGTADYRALPAKTVEAFVLIDRALAEAGRGRDQRTTR